MNYFLMMLTSLFGQDTFLVKQDDITVQLNELDAYVLSMNQDDRAKFAENKKSIENTIITLLNINIIKDYVDSSELKEQTVFKEITSEEFDKKSVEELTQFATVLDIDTEVLKSAYRQYQIDNKYYRTLLSYLGDQTTDNIEGLAHEYYLVNIGDYRIAEKRSLSVIVLDAETSDPKAILSDLTDASQDEFEAVAAEVSVDASVDLNSGEWGEFREPDFRYRFAADVFSDDTGVGVLNKIYKKAGQYYLIRVNAIVPEKVLPFDEVKDEISENIKGKIVTQKFQNILNQKAMHQVEVNAELAAHVFERYKVFSQ